MNLEMPIMPHVTTCVVWNYAGPKVAPAQRVVFLDSGHGAGTAENFSGCHQKRANGPDHKSPCNVLEDAAEFTPSLRLDPAAVFAQLRSVIFSIDLHG